MGYEGGFAVWTFRKLFFLFLCVKQNVISTTFDIWMAMIYPCNCKKRVVITSTMSVGRMISVSLRA